MAKDKRNRAAATPPTATPASAAGSEESPPEVADVAPVSAGAEAPEASAPLGQPSPTPGLVVCVVKHGVLRRDGVDYAVGDPVGLPSADASALALLGAVDIV